MKTIFDKQTRDSLIARTQQLNTESEAIWGKMNVYQMTQHCTIWNRWVLGIDNQIPYKQMFLGKIIGKMLLKSSTKNDKPLGKNAPAGSAFLVSKKTGDLAKQKQELITLIEQFADYNNPAFIHDFFGRMTEEQI
ncbi:DUF1569 domain-containing protein, partial [Fulvivirga sp. RKSG066]|uniref:DUF1569 domain-containing protein n=1 Tax=Fulvivirga aurantia TaxID=2529383 RepID=UPI0012BCE4DE